MTDFTCTRCHYNAKCKSSLIRHLKRVRPCQPVDSVSNVSNVSNTFNTISGLWDCGFENLDYLDDDFLDHVVTNQDMNALVKMVSFHPEHAENHNMFYFDDKWFHVQDCQWCLSSEKYLVQEAFCTYYKIIDKWLKKNGRGVSWLDRNKTDTIKVDISNVIKMQGISHMEEVARNVANKLRASVALRDFGYENLDYLDDYFLDIVITNRDFYALVKTIHFNPKHPYNNNLLVSGGKWFYLSRGDWFELNEASFRKKVYDTYHMIIDRWLKKKDIRIPWFDNLHDNNNDIGLMKELITDAIKMECAI
jgi:hypothetical protein